MTSLGSITSLGVGSGFDLQQMLEDFREVDETPIDLMRDEKTGIQDKITQLDAINAKLITMKSHALALSLGSNFIEKSVAVSDEEIASATVLSGTEETSGSIEIKKLATKNSWQTAGVEGTDTIAYIPVSQESQDGFDDTDTTAAVTADGTLTVTYGSGASLKTINVSLTNGMTLDGIKDAVNNDSENDDGESSTYVTASTFTGDDGKHYLRISSTEAGTGESNRVMVTASPDELDFAAPDSAFTYALGEGDNIVVSVPADTTFAELAALINDDVNNGGITASVINDGNATNPYRLVITSDETGEDNRITLSGIQMTEVQGAESASLNAEIVVDGITYYRQSNEDIDDIIQGVTLKIEKEGTFTVTVSSNTDLVKSEIIALVEAYNDIVQTIKTDTAYNSETKEWGVLSDSYSIKGLPYQLNNLAGAIIETYGGDITSMYDLGMEFGRDGSISIDEETLDEVIASDFDDMAKFFLSDDDLGITGLADIMNESLRNMTRSSGLMDNEKDYAESEIDRIEQDIESATDVLDRRYDLLASEFIELDKYIGRLNATSDYLTTMFSAIEDSKTK